MIRSLKLLQKVLVTDEGYELSLEDFLRADQIFQEIRPSIKAKGIRFAGEEKE